MQRATIQAQSIRIASPDVAEMLANNSRTAKQKAPYLLVGLLVSWCGFPLGSPAQATGRIVGTVRDQTGAAIAGALVTVVSSVTAELQTTTTDAAGEYSVVLLTPGPYSVKCAANHFKTVLLNNVLVALAETAHVDVGMKLETIQESVTIEESVVAIPADGSQRGTAFDSGTIDTIPLATRNFTQMLALAPGVSAPLVNYSEIGRNSLDISVNGARITQNVYELDGIDLSNWGTNTASRIALPVPESIQELRVDSTRYDAVTDRTGGGTIQMIAKKGGDNLHGAIFGYLQNDALNANNTFLNAAGASRPMLRRNVFGGVLGGPIRKDRAFYFLSYQGARETNGATDNSLSSNVLIAPCPLGSCLTDDRSPLTLLRTFRPTDQTGLPVLSPDPIAVALLNARLPDGGFLIPTPQVDGHYSGSTPSTYDEDMLGSNFDIRLKGGSSLGLRALASKTDSDLAMYAGTNVPGFAADRRFATRVLAAQHVSSIGPHTTNEARVAYSYIRSDSYPEEPFGNNLFGIQRQNAAQTLGFPQIRIAAGSGGVSFGTSGGNIDFQSRGGTLSLFDVLSVQRRSRLYRMGIEFRDYQNAITTGLNTRGLIDFNSFNDFLIGFPASSVFGSGIGRRDFRARDYSIFVQDDWKLRPRLTLNLGLRYDLMLPASDALGRITTFDPGLYQPRMAVNDNGNPIGPPASGFVQAGNVIPSLDLPEVANGSNSLLRSSDPNNFGPRLGFAYSPMQSGRLVIRSGYGMFYSRVSTFFLGSKINLPPNYVIARTSLPSFSNPFPPLPSSSEFPVIIPGISLSNPVFDRNMRTPYLHKYSFGIQYSLSAAQTVEIAYVGTRALNLFRNVAINQSPLAAPQQPIVNAVTGQAITTNTPANASLRAPFQGVAISSFGQIQTTAQASYNSAQVTLTRRLSKGFELQASYTFAKSIDNTSSASALNPGNDDASAETPFIRGNQFDNRGNRGLSDFDQTHRFELSYAWDLPHLASVSKSPMARRVLSDWHLAGVFIASSGYPIDVVDSGAGSLYGLSGNAGALARPNPAPGVDPRRDIPAGYFFNPYAFVRPMVQPNQPIPSSAGTAVAGALGTDIGSVGRNTLRGPAQSNLDFSVSKRIVFRETSQLEFRADFFNLLNQVNLANPISNLNAVLATGGNMDPTSGQIKNSSGDFGRITATTNNPRLIQFSLRLIF